MLQHLFVLFAPEKKRKSRVTPARRLEGPRVLLRPLQPGDSTAWLRLRGISRDFLQPWEPDWPAAASQPGYYRGYLRRLRRRWARDLEYAFLVCGRNAAPMGGITLTDIRREAVQAATLGIWMGEPFAGRGYMKEAAALILDFAFHDLHLHRVEATCMPENGRSLGLLRGLGMREIGLSRQHMKINGQWRDHVLFEKVSPSALPNRE